MEPWGGHLGPLIRGLLLDFGDHRQTLALDKISCVTIQRGLSGLKIMGEGLAKGYHINRSEIDEIMFRLTLDVAE